MHVSIDFDNDHLHVEARDRDLIVARRSPSAPSLSDPASAVRDALETPMGFPALRRALTPDDHVAVVVDERLPRLTELLIPVLQHVAGAGVSPAAITLLCPFPSSGQKWIDELPDDFQDVRIEVHDPSSRKLLAYLATAKGGRRLYLNRTAVDADQLVVLAGRRYDPLLGYAGSEGAIYPALSDEKTRRELLGRLSMTAPGDVPWPVQAEATEAAWLLGAPFIVQVIEGPGEEVIHVLAGLTDTTPRGQQLLNARWRVEVEDPVDTVIAGISGDPARHGFDDLARALACASRVVRPGGRIVLLSRAKPDLGEGAEILRRADSPEEAIASLRRSPPDAPAAFQWASSALQASLYLFSEMQAETAEEMFVIPLEKPSQVQRWIDADGSCLFLADAHKLLAVTGANTPRGQGTAKP